MIISTMQEHERLVGKLSESQNQTAQNLNVGQDLPGQAMDLDKIPGLLGLYDAYLLWLEGKVSATIWTELGQ